MEPSALRAAIAKARAEYQEEERKKHDLEMAEAYKAIDDYVLAQVRQGRMKILVKRADDYDTCVPRIPKHLDAMEVIAAYAQRHGFTLHYGEDELYDGDNDEYDDDVIMIIPG